MDRLIRTLIVALVATTISPEHVSAQSRPLPQHVLSRGVAERPHASRPPLGTQPNNRMLYCRIETIRGNVLTVRARNGRRWRVDASEALRNGTYSAPLFVGKLVSITGYIDTTHTLHAATITRETLPDARTAIDR